MSAAQATRRGDQPRVVSSMLLALPLALILLFFVVAPLLAVVTVSFFRYDNFAVIPGFHAGELSERPDFPPDAVALPDDDQAGGTDLGLHFGCRDSALLTSWCFMSAAS